MTARAALLLVLLASTSPLTACEPADTAPPVGDSTMVAVLVDLHLVGARERLGHDVPAGLRDSVLAAHALDSTTFRQGMAWYEARPEAYVAVYGAVVDQLNADRAP